MKLIEGQLIQRRYRLDERLAQGGMGEVWKGYDIELGRVVAVKALRGDLTPENSKLARLRTEAHNSANLAHPNIVALFEYYESDGIGFLIMEYVENESLATIYKREGALPATRLLPILTQTARGLYVAHSHGVIHRDVKPANIMVSPIGQVKITDFGVSYSTNQAAITQDGMVVGTAQYISPEQAQGEQATAQSDIYSLGIVAYEGLVGHRPFTGKTPVDIAAAHVNDPVPPLPDSIDHELANYVMKMLAKDPSQRPHSTLEISQRFSAIERRLLDLETQPHFSTDNDYSGYEHRDLYPTAQQAQPEAPKRSFTNRATSGFARFMETFGFGQTVYTSDEISLRNNAEAVHSADESQALSRQAHQHEQSQLEGRQHERNQYAQHSASHNPFVPDYGIATSERDVYHTSQDVLYEREHAPGAKHSDAYANHFTGTFIQPRVVSSRPHGNANIIDPTIDDEYT